MWILNGRTGWRAFGSWTPLIRPLFGLAGSLEVSSFHPTPLAFTRGSQYAHFPTTYPTVLSENSAVSIAGDSCCTLVGVYSLPGGYMPFVSRLLCYVGLPQISRKEVALLRGRSRCVLCTGSRCAARSRSMHPFNCVCWLRSPSPHLPC